MVGRHGFAAGETALPAFSLGPFPGITDNTQRLHDAPQPDELKPFTAWKSESEKIWGL